MEYETVIFWSFLILLVFILLTYAIMLYNTSSAEIYPPVQASCPDWWNSSTTNNKNICINEKKLGSHTCNSTMNFDTNEWKGADHICKKKKWAEACDLTWDGITNTSMKC